MKKIVALLAVLCLLFTGGISCSQVLQMKAENTAASQQAAALVTETPAVQIDTVDLAALYAKYPPEATVASVNGRDVTWSEYFYFYGSYILDVESAMQYYAQYGYPVSWDDVFDESSGKTWSDLPSDSTVQDIREYTAIATFAEENGIVLSADAEAEIEASLLEAAKDALGEDAGLEAFEAFLSQYYLPLDVYRQMLRTGSLYNQILREHYQLPEDADDEAVEQARQSFSSDLTPVYENTAFTYSDGFVLPSLP